MSLILEDYVTFREMVDLMLKKDSAITHNTTVGEAFAYAKHKVNELAAKQIKECEDYENSD